ncbi:inositol monophosphatase family protein [Sphaerochaeta globosa]|jgi:myo-inositol-1(or 4)-monophosphatase|uniref:Inositol-1-monophosphatase n=1 Tax=Sphaerochaeta globosa (strain ATCC BAA-1886 / DSM 22777 / Buddy) TaxID=158189 RepID=F0RTS7_SPHGB|nr:inositol monophosphatase family protein [Sphaerochaeta globosa]ADY13842.1 inositol monophosphatase [Sphaerochaeta globosa str. Buddy]
MNNTNLIARHLEVALQAARLAGSYVLEAGKNPQIEVHDKHLNDFVTDADRACEELIIATIRKHFPDDAIFGEETGTSGESAHGRWIIDPIDGTTNFFRSLPNYTISIAWEIEPFHPLVGVVFNPRQQELFWASEGAGAYLNGQPIVVSSVKEFAKALMVCVPPHRRHELVDTYFETAKRIFLATSDFRSYGSCALELAYIASGRLDGYYELCLGYYDMAAGLMLVREAGGMVESADPKQPFTDTRCDLIASNGLIHQHILHMVHA